MKTSTILLIVTIIAVLSGLALTIVSNAFPTVTIRGDQALAIFFSVAFALKFGRDFSRRNSVRPLTTRKLAPVLRPVAPIYLDARHASTRRHVVNDRNAA